MGETKIKIPALIMWSLGDDKSSPLHFILDDNTTDLEAIYPYYCWKDCMSVLGEGEVENIIVQDMQ